MTFALLALVLVLGFLLGIFLIVKKVQNLNGNPKQIENLPPGPWGLPLLGHLVSLGLNPHLTLIKWKQKYGPIISCRFGSFPTVVLCDSKLIREAFNMNELSGRPQVQVYHENMGKGIVFTEGSYNTELRHFTIRKFKEFGMGRKGLEDQIHEGISEFMDFVKMRENLPIKSEDFPSAHIIRTLWSIMMTDELNAQIAELGPVLSELAGFMPWMEKIVRTLSSGHFSLISGRAKQIREMASFVSKQLEGKKEIRARGQIQSQGQGQGQVPKDIMDFYLEKVAETTDKSSPFHASQDSADNFLADIFGAEIHTTQTTLLWLLVYTARNAEVQLKLQEEIDEVIENGSGNGNDLSTSRLPSLSDRGQMPYAEAVINEVLRMSSVMPLLVPHEATADVSFLGYAIKKGTMLFANIYGVHHDPEIWGDPENFRPDRWFGEQGKKLKSEHFHPFSTGRRICPGEALAREELFLYLTTLFQKYTVSFHGNTPEIKGVFGVSLHPSKFTVIFSERKINKS